MRQIEDSGVGRSGKPHPLLHIECGHGIQSLLNPGDGEVINGEKPRQARTYSCSEQLDLLTSCEGGRVDSIEHLLESRRDVLLHRTDVMRDLEGSAKELDWSRGKGNLLTINGQMRIHYPPLPTDAFRAKAWHFGTFAFIPDQEGHVSTVWSSSWAADGEFATRHVSSAYCRIDTAILSEMVSQVPPGIDCIHHGVHEYDHRQGVTLVDPYLQCNRGCGPVGRGDCCRKVRVECMDKVEKLEGSMIVSKSKRNQ